MAPPLLILRDIHLSFGGTPLLEGAELVVGAGDRLCLVGRNGSGKSTLMRIAAGLIAADGGERFVQPGSTVRYLPQEPDLSGFATTLDYVAAGLAPGDDPHRARYLLDQLGLSDTATPATLSGGEARRAALARVLAPEPDILLLDEPTNHLDLPAIEWLESELAGLRSALVLVSHDRRFLQSLSRATVWLSLGKARRLDKGFGEFEAWRDEILEQESRIQHKQDRKIAAETEWLHKGVTARRKRNQGRLRALMTLRKDRRERREAPGTTSAVSSTTMETSGELVIEAKRISKSYGPTPVVANFSLRILRGDRIGIVGPNGAGKTTLLKMLTGTLEPDEGMARLGRNLTMVTLDQKRDSLDPERSVAETLTEGGGDTVDVGGTPRHVIGYMKDFLFSPEQVRTPVGVLSGGERGRLLLARTFAKSSNLLVLDEPTNDLDLETLDLLQEMLGDYPGTVLLVSHDRDFLDRVTTAVIGWDGEGRWVVYAGGYSDMLAQRGGTPLPTKSGAPAPAPAPKKVTPKPPAPSTAAKTRLSFKEKHALEKLPGRLDALQQEIGKLQAVLADPDVYARDPAAFTAAVARLGAAEAEFGQAEDEWLTLELKRESLEGA